MVISVTSLYLIHQNDKIPTVEVKTMFCCCGCYSKIKLFISQCFVVFNGVMQLYRPLVDFAINNT